MESFSLQVAALKGLGLNIRRAKLETGAGAMHKFYITDERKSGGPPGLERLAIAHLWMKTSPPSDPNHNLDLCPQSSMAPSLSLTPPARLSVLAGSSEKVIKAAKIEEIRLTILNNMLAYHPESGEQLAWGSDAARSASAIREVDPTRPLGQRK
jgi:hypothetical protein